MRALLLLAGFAAVAAVPLAARFALHPCCQWLPQSVAPVPAAEASAARVEPAQAPCAPTRAASAEAVDETTLLLPDGSRVPALNGARSPKPMSEVWPVSVPWSPITGVEHSPAGIDWFVHADGSRSTTQMVWRADLGREDAMTRLARPTPQVPAPVAAKN